MVSFVREFTGYGTDSSVSFTDPYGPNELHLLFVGLDTGSQITPTMANTQWELLHNTYYSSGYIQLLVYYRLGVPANDSNLLSFGASVDHIISYVTVDLGLSAPPGGPDKWRVADVVDTDSVGDISLAPGGYGGPPALNGDLILNWIVTDGDDVNVSDDTYYTSGISRSHIDIQPWNSSTAVGGYQHAAEYTTDRGIQPMSFSCSPTDQAIGYSIHLSPIAVARGGGLLMGDL
jgi:hypothetical protein